MIDSYVEPLNEIGFVFDGKKRVVRNVERFTESDETVELQPNGEQLTQEKTTHYARIYFQEGNQVEMKLRNLDGMIERAKDHGVL